MTRRQETTMDRCEMPGCTHEGTEYHYLTATGVIDHEAVEDDRPDNPTLLCSDHTLYLA